MVISAFVLKVWNVREVGEVYIILQHVESDIENIMYRMCVHLLYNVVK